MRNKRKTREERLCEILEAGKKVFLKKGYENATMEDIIAETELSKGGFYYYYSDKKEIMIDIMKSSNIMYMKYNDNMVKLSEVKNYYEKKEVLINAILDKFLPVTEDKRLYTMFACQIPIEMDFWEVYLELEATFFKWLGEKLHINISLKENQEKFKLVSRTINGLLFTQNIFRDPDVFQDNKEMFKKFFEPLVDDILSIC